MEQKKYDIFISYSRKDFDEVNAFVEKLKLSFPGLSYWFDITGIESGDEFEEKIITAIDNSAYVLFAMSDNSINSQWTKDEVMYARNTEKKVVPVLMKGAKLQGWFLFKFGRVNCIDYTDSIQLDQLIRNLADWTGKRCSANTTLSPKELTKKGDEHYEKEEYEEAVKYYQKAAEMGYAQAQHFLGWAYNTGEGIKQDYAEAVKWYRKAANQGHEKAQNNLGLMYNNGHGVAKDLTEAVKWYKLSAEQGYLKAQNNLGNMYYSGEGVTQDFAEAMKWYKKAEKQGYTDAQYNIACMYYNGLSVTQDYAEAIKWFRKAAEQEMDIAQYMVGVMYDYGYGVTEDSSQAKIWYRKAAEQGHELAIERLKELGEKL